MRTGGGEEEKGRWGGVCENVAPEIGKHLLFDLTQNSGDRVLLDLEIAIYATNWQKIIKLQQTRNSPPMRGVISEHSISTQPIYH